MASAVDSPVLADCAPGLEMDWLMNGPPSPRFNTTGPGIPYVFGPELRPGIPREYVLGEIRIDSPIMLFGFVVPPDQIVDTGRETLAGITATLDAIYSK